MKRSIRQDKARAECPESELQDYADALLEAKGIPFLRLPAGMFKVIFANPAIPIHHKAMLKDALAGWPDNLTILPISPRFNVCLCLELKTTTGKLHGMQKTRAKEMAWWVARDREEISRAIAKLEWLAVNLKRDLEKIEGI